MHGLTGSAFLLGVVGLLGADSDTFVSFSPFAGVLVDRWDRRRILVWTQALSALQSLALAMMTLSHTITVAWIVALQIVQGIINAFDTPARQSFVVQMVDDPADLPNAIALNSTMVNASRIIGPSIGGLIIAAVGEGWCFLIDAISYIAVIASLLAMRVTRAERIKVRGAVLQELPRGLPLRGGDSRRFERRSYSWRSLAPWERRTPCSCPSSRRTCLHGGPHTLGFLMTASGLGAVVGALYPLASRRTVLKLGRIIICRLHRWPLAPASSRSGLVRSLWVAMLVLPVVGAGFMVEMAATNTILQTITEEHLRGRVMAFYTMAFLGTAPIGSLIAGIAAARIGAQHTIMLGGVACILGALWLAIRLPLLREQIRPIYVERGILSSSQALNVRSSQSSRARCHPERANPHGSSRAGSEDLLLGHAVTSTADPSLTLGMTP